MATNWADYLSLVYSVPFWEAREKKRPWIFMSLLLAAGRAGAARNARLNWHMLSLPREPSTGPLAGWDFRGGECAVAGTARKLTSVVQPYLHEPDVGPLQTACLRLDSSP